MSIETILKDRVDKNMLHLLKPKAKGATSYRVLLIADRLQRVLEKITEDTEWEERVGWLIADLEVFVTSQFLRPEYLFCLYPRSKGVWEIRSVQHDPSIRIFGLFAMKDVFVATNFALRSDLGEWESQEWKRERRNATAEWNGLMQPYNPVYASTEKEVISGALDGKYFKK